MIVDSEGMNAASCHHGHADAPKERVLNRNKLRHIAALAIVVPELATLALTERKELPTTRNNKRVIVAAANGYRSFQRHLLRLVRLPPSNAAAKCQELAIVP